MDEARKLEPIEARILGVLIEKEFTTPEQYPLSLHALTAGCNQKSNRDPVLDLSEHDVNLAVGKMIVKGWAGSIQPAGGRVEKYRHNAGEVLGVGKAALAVLAELCMRGPQQPGELRVRSSRMVDIPTLAALSDVLAPLRERGLVVRLDPAPGSRAETYAQTLAPGAHALPSRAPAALASPVMPPPVAATPAAVDTGPLERRIAELDHELQKLRRQLANLAWKLGEKLDPS